MKITVQMLENDQDDPDFENYILFEGDRLALEFMGRLFLAQSRFPKDCSFFIGPTGAGSMHFSRESTLGLYVHRLPCLEKKGLQLASRSPTAQRKTMKRR